MPILNNTEKNIHTSTVSWDDNGIAEASIVYSIGSSLAVADAMSMQAHHVYPYLKRSNGTVTFKEGNMAEVSMSFKGVDPDADQQVITTIRSTLTNEPIDTHPTFTDWSKQFAPILNPDGSFKAFPPKIDQIGEEGGEGEVGEVVKVNNPKAGITDYLDPSITFEQSKIFAVASSTKLANEIKNIGFIDDSFYTGSGIPKAPTPMGDDDKPRNWLLTSGNFEEIGDGGKVTKVWRLSGRRQWDSIIYSPEEKEDVSQLDWLEGKGLDAINELN